MIQVVDCKIWYYAKPVDFRSQIDGLILMVATVLHEDPLSGQLFLFRNKHGDKIKILYWDGNGFCLLYKRMERGRFKLNNLTDGKIQIRYEELHYLIQGVDISKLPKPTHLNLSFRS